MGLFAELRLGVQFYEDTWLVTQDKYMKVSEIGAMAVPDEEKIALYRPGTYAYTLYGDNLRTLLLNDVECAAVKVSMPYYGIEENIVAFAGSVHSTKGNSNPVVEDAVYYLVYMYNWENRPISGVLLNGANCGNNLNTTVIKDGDEIVIN